MTTVLFVHTPHTGGVPPTYKTYNTYNTYNVTLIFSLYVINYQGLTILRKTQMYFSKRQATTSWRIIKAGEGSQRLGV